MINRVDHEDDEVLIEMVDVTETQFAGKFPAGGTGYFEMMANSGKKTQIRIDAFIFLFQKFDF